MFNVNFEIFPNKSFFWESVQGNPQDFPISGIKFSSPIFELDHVWRIWNVSSFLTDTDRSLFRYFSLKKDTTFLDYSIIPHSVIWSNMFVRLFFVKLNNVKIFWAHSEFSFSKKVYLNKIIFGEWSTAWIANSWKKFSTQKLQLLKTIWAIVKKVTIGWQRVEFLVSIKIAVYVWLRLG